MPEFKKNRVIVLNEDSMLSIWVRDITRYKERAASLNSMKKTFESDLAYMMEKEEVDAICLGDSDFWGSYENAPSIVLDKEAVFKAHPHLRKKNDDIIKMVADFNDALEVAAEEDKDKFYKEKAGSSQFRALKAITIDGMTISKKKPLEKLLSKSVVVE